MSYFQIIFALVLVVSIISSVVKNYKKTKLKLNLKTKIASTGKSDKPKRQGSVMSQHASWDEAAWGDQATKNKHGHKIPTWAKPKWDKPPQTAASQFRAKQINLNDGFAILSPSYGLWLYLAGLAVVVNLVGMIYFGYMDFEFFSNMKPLELDPRVALDDWGDTEYAAPNPAFGWYANITLSMVALLVLGLIVTIYKYFEKSSEFPKLFVSLHLGMLVYAVADALAYNYFEPYSGFIGAIALPRDALILASIILFVPYMLLSSRVKAVFIER